MDRARIKAWMESPGPTGFADGVALLRAYHQHDAEGLATLLENCNPYEALKAVVSIYEASLISVEVDPCVVLDGLQISVIEPPEENRT